MFMTRSFPDVSSVAGGSSEDGSQPQVATKESLFAPAATLLVESGVVALALARQGKLLFVNRAFRRLFKLQEGAGGTALKSLLETSDWEQVDDDLKLAGQRSSSCLVAGLRGDGSNFDLELRFSEVVYEGETLQAIFAQDITNRSQTSARLSLLAYSDPLTGLANRAQLADRLRQVLLEFRHSSNKFAVLALDLDGFKPINDRYGHDAGDFVLQRIGQRLEACVRDTDTVARFGGDEFAILLPHIKDRAHAALSAERLIEVVRQPINTGKHVVEVSVSIGIAMFPDHGSAVDQLYAVADHALYAAKQNGRNQYSWATDLSPAESVPSLLVWNAAHELGIPEMDEQHAKLAALLNNLGLALKNADPYESIIAEIIRYTSFHFAAEERLMKGCDYKGAAHHRELHRQLLEDIRDLKLDDNEMSVSLVLRFLQDWLVRHVEGADRDLANALLARRAATV
jgi:diguanylate cyclase (GGDEF)-like protein/hemerythrin-like metal-binding protein/PAS domain S-box-containing protein